MSNFFDKWREICDGDNIEHLTIPRTILFGWGLMILLFQTLSIFVRIEIFVQFAGWAWLIIFFLFHQYCRIWRRYYSVFWPILIHLLALAATLYIKAGYL